MKANSINAIANQLPQVFERREHVWPDDVAILRGNIDDALEDTLQDDLFDPNPDSTADESSAPISGSVERTELERVHDELSDILGPNEFPGVPIRPRDNRFLPPTDCYAFYLPWHHFYEWGIYLLVEGIEALGKELEILSAQKLSTFEARHIARLFLFHHEAYHNAVETFAARLEVTHRVPCYIGGFRRKYENHRQGTYHEESFANAYAALKVKTNAFSSVVPTRRRTELRRLAVAALCEVFKRQPPPYDLAAGLIPEDKDEERAFQEVLHEACFAGKLPLLDPKIWNAFPHALHPSLSRNGAFSYVIHRSHPYARSRANVFYFDRRKFLQRLSAERPGRIIHGGKHPKWETQEGLKVPVPTGDLAHGTARSILKGLGVLNRYGTVDRFMSGVTI